MTKTKTKTKTAAPAAQPQGAAPDEHSRLVGGSTAGIRLACPGSYQLELKLPASAFEGSSTYADEGTACHEAMAYMIENDLTVDDVIGMEFGREGAKFVMDDKLADACLRPALDYFDSLLDELEAEDGAHEPQFLVEKRVEVPGIHGAFGTCDMIIRNGKRTVILDWKFGAGVPVKAIYLDDENGDLLNPQLMFYARGAQHSYPGFFGAQPDYPVELVIVQPRARGEEEHRVTRAQTDLKELDEYRWALVRAVAEARDSKEPTIARGDHCRWCKAKPLCPRWTAPLSQLAQVKATVEERKDTLPGARPDDGELFAIGFSLIEAFEEWSRDFLQLGHQFMDSGGKVPGHKLVPKRATEKYVDEDGAAKMARSLGFQPDEIVEKPALRSPAQLAAVIEPKMEGSTKKARTEAARLAIAAFTEKVSSGTTIAHEDDRREAVIPMGEVVKDFQNKMALLVGRTGE